MSLPTVPKPPTRIKNGPTRAYGRAAKYGELNEPLSIAIRLRAAIREDIDYQLLHYARKEGATHEIVRLAAGNKDIVVVANNLLKRMYEGCQFISICSRRIHDINNKIVILDIGSKSGLMKDIRVLREGNNKVIHLKGIVLDRQDNCYYMNGEKIEGE